MFILGSSTYESLLGIKEGTFSPLLFIYITILMSVYRYYYYIYDWRRQAWQGRETRAGDSPGVFFSLFAITTSMEVLKFDASRERTHWQVGLCTERVMSNNGSRP
jgi:hypothetical protein